MLSVATKAKAVAALVVVAAGEAITYGVLPVRYQGWAQIVVAVGAYAGVYAAPKNAPKPTA